MRILAGTDGSGTATEAVRKAYTLASVYAGTVTLVHVGDPLVGAIKLDEVASAKPEDVEVERRAVEGDPAQLICELAEAENVQLVVVGNKGMSGVTAVPGFRAQQGRARGSLGRLDREDGGPLDRRPRRRPRRPRHRGREAARGLPRRRGHHPRALAPVHPHGLHGRLERQREDLGLSLPRFDVSPPTGPWCTGPLPSRSSAWEGRRQGRAGRRRGRTSPRRRTAARRARTERAGS